ncbi:sensor histidine kinase [Azospirillum agricola]|uniref:sensor histidine kinase n=1 Tax=Azospirillum agricola TaxID=1720247 RepID=UPI0015C4986A|nr:histidine kinase dimerization/phosphoacceptor domain -containing protein [Azospirillum agricola]
MGETADKGDRQQSALLDFTRLLASYIPVERLLPLTALRLARGSGVSHTMVLRYDGDRSNLVLEAGTGWGPGLVGTKHFPIDANSPAGRSYLTRHATVVGDLLCDEAHHVSAFQREHGIRSLVDAPVLSGGMVWGVLKIASTQPHVFTGTDARFLQVMANILGVAVERAADHEAARQTAQRTAKEAAAALAEREMRLNELQHRMKNNLAVIAAMVQLEGHQQEDKRIKERFNGLMARIGAIAMAHEQLSATQETTMVELAPYMDRLAGNLALQHEGITILADVEPLLVPLDQAVPLGLIVNELLTNAAKYAFPTSANGTVRIALAAEPSHHEAVLTVADDGVGMGPPRKGSLGTMLVQSLAGQIGGTALQRPIERGTCWKVRFPLLPGS